MIYPSVSSSAVIASLAPWPRPPRPGRTRRPDGRLAGHKARLPEHGCGHGPWPRPGPRRGPPIGPDRLLRLCGRRRGRPRMPCGLRPCGIHLFLSKSGAPPVRSGDGDLREILFQKAAGRAWHNRRPKEPGSCGRSGRRDRSSPDLGGRARTSARPQVIPMGDGARHERGTRGLWPLAGRSRRWGGRRPRRMRRPTRCRRDSRRL
jgi:hypothetical protein